MMKDTLRAASWIGLFLALASPVAGAGVAINEIFYNAPQDRDDVQWIELHNASDAAADVSGWTLDDGKIFVLPANTSIPAGGYLVVALNVEAFGKAYEGVVATGPLKRPLKRSGERIELKDSAGKSIDVAKFKDRDPWPVSGDGYSASIERICPAASGEEGTNWAGSALPPLPKPAGTPGKKNGVWSAVPLPAIKTRAKDDALAGEAIAVEAEVKDDAPAKEVALLYRAGTGEEAAVAMARQADGRYAGSIPAQPAGTLVRYRIKAVAANGAVRFYPAETDLRPTLSAFVHEKYAPSKLPQMLILRGPGAAQATEERRGRGPFDRGQQQTPRPVRGTSTLVSVDAATGKVRVFDHINIVPRSGGRGYNVFFHKDEDPDGMSSISLVFEGSEWSMMAEHLAYDLCRRAGNASSLTDFVRVSVDGKAVGYHLRVERPNRSFLRRNKLDDNGNLYKLIWYGQGIEGQHEKKTNAQQGHADLLALIEKLRTTQGDAQWAVIQENFNVDQVATYFAVNMILSHWDGFFNNYFTYHDVNGSGKWEMYPWDQDNTWGFYGGLQGDEVFFDLPLNFGANGSRPPGGEGGGRFGGGRVGWWREPGYFSGPLLANEQFRKVFLAKTRDILDRHYNEQTYGPMIDALVERLKEDARLRAQLRGRDPETGAGNLVANADFLRMHLRKRRAFLLDQPELKALAAPGTTGAPAGIATQPAAR